MRNSELSTKAYQLVEWLDGVGYKGAKGAAQVVREMRAEIESLEAAEAVDADMLWAAIEDLKDILDRHQTMPERLRGEP